MRTALYAETLLKLDEKLFLLIIEFFGKFQLYLYDETAFSFTMDIHDTLIIENKLLFVFGSGLEIKLEFAVE